MGCDIHVIAEVKIANKWHSYKAMRPDRNYKVFSKICGVRIDNDSPLVPLREIPEDASSVTILSYKDWELDAHSQTWLSSEEIVGLDSWFRERWGYDYALEDWLGNSYLFGNEWTKESLPNGIDDFRWIIWFDN